MDKQQVKNAMTDEGKNLRLLIKDLVDVPEIKTVIQLEDLKAPELRRMIVETFVITGEVEENLRSIFTSLSRQKGRGIFLKGHFGSGKSHFLSMLSLLLRYPQSWETVISQVPSLADFEEKIRGLRFLVVDISLVQHRGSELLEEIFLSSIIKELGTETKPCFEGAHTRHETFRKIKALLKEHRLSGMFILVDELSEFLRSKADAHAYNEDIRFLQYLGEEAEGFPLWIVASLQEWIEETGEIVFYLNRDTDRIVFNVDGVEYVHNGGKAGDIITIPFAPEEPGPHNLKIVKPIETAVVFYSLGEV